MTPNPPFSPDPATAHQLDAADELATFRQAFFFAENGPGSNLIYLDGNSLGRLPLASAGELERVVREQWGKRLIRGWGEGWYEAPGRVGEKIARLVGAAPGQVLVCDSTSINLYKLVMAALALRPGRAVILSDRANFTTDLYVLQGCIHTLGSRHTLRLAEDDLAIPAAMDEDTALVVLSQVAFKSGALYDAPAITRSAHESGALVLWDLSHSAGVVPVALDEWGVDFAVGCTYKYLNGGPGSPAYLYVRVGLQEQVRSPIWGWFGDRSPFAFDLQYEPAPGIRRFLTGTPPILSLLALEPGLDLLLEAGIERIRVKSLRQTTYLIELAEAYLVPLGFTLATPRDPARRGGHVSLRHPDGYRINRALIEEMNVIPDFREPDNLRLGIAPLYTSYAEIWEAVDRIARVVKEGRYLKYPEQRAAVT